MRLFIFLFFGSHNFEFPGPQISKFLDFQVPRSPDSQNPRFPDAADGGGCGRTLRSQPDPSPNAPRDQIRRKGPCCDPFCLKCCKVITSRSAIPALSVGHFFQTKSTARVSLAEVFNPRVRWEGPGSGLESLSAAGGIWKSGIFQISCFASI